MNVRDFYFRDFDIQDCDLDRSNKIIELTKTNETQRRNRHFRMLRIFTREI